MSNVDPQLVRRIAEQVLARMTDEGAVASPHAGHSAQPAAVRPPTGVCTGDYAQFIERPDLVPSADASDRSPQTSRSHNAADRTFTGVVTARQIHDSGLATIRLGPGAQLTPLAADHVRSAGLTVERAAASTHHNTSAAPPANTDAWLWWIDGHCDAVRQLTSNWREQLSPLAPLGQGSALADVVTRAARSVSEGRHAGAILFVHSAARAACYANRCPSLRAVVGTCGEAVQQGIDLLAANVLIIEYPHHGPKSMRAMVEQFTGAARPSLPNVDRQLRELASCA